MKSYFKSSSGAPWRAVRELLTLPGLAMLLTALWIGQSQAQEEPPPAMLSTDQSVYWAGSTALISGSGFAAGEAVTLQLFHADGAPATGANDGPWELLADETGAFFVSWDVCQEDCVGVTVVLAATGQASGQSAQIAFVIDPLFTTYVFTDKSDYMPGSIAYIAGGGFEPGEAVTLQVHPLDGGTASAGGDFAPWTVTTDTDGTFESTWHVCEDCFGATFMLSALGQSSGASASTYFTDGCPTGGGEVDLSFDAGSAIDSIVYAVALQPDGKVILGGAFTRVNGARRSRIARLNADGTTDLGFLNGLAGIPIGEVRSIAVQPDGKILVGGTFAAVNGVTRRGLARLNSDGSLDTSFTDPGIQTSSTAGTVYSIVVQPDGRILISGTFLTVNGMARNRIARLNDDGTLDTTFQNGMAGASSTVWSIALQTDGKPVIGGAFISVNGVARNRLARLNSDGSLDTAFLDTPLTGVNQDVFSVALEPDGQVLIGGSFSAVNGVTRNRIARLDSDGTLDTSFTASANNQIISVVPQPDGKVLIGGTFLSVNSVTRNRIARLNSDGTLDTAFQNGLSGTAGSLPSVFAVALQSGGQVLIGGAYTSVNDVIRNRIARLNTDGSLDTSFENGPPGPQSVSGLGTVRTVVVQPDAKILIGGGFTHVGGLARSGFARLNSDGTPDLGFLNGLSGASGPSVAVNALDVQPDGKVLVAGVFNFINGVARGRVARVHPDGSLDTTFLNGLSGTSAGSTVEALVLQSDGKVLIGGNFTAVNGVARRGLARLNSDGSLDMSFVDPLIQFGTFVGAVFGIALQPDGKILVVGNINNVNGVSRNGIARLNSDGTLDTGFLNGLTGVNLLPVFSVAAQPDGKILIGGNFGMVNGVARTRLARLNDDGTLDTTFLSSPSGVVISMALQPDGRILVGGSFGLINGVPRIGIGRVNNDGSLDTTFLNGLTGVNSGATVESIALQSDGNVLIGGNFTTVNDTVSEAVARLFGNGVDITAPTIACPANQTVPTDPGQCAAIVNYPAPLAADECSTVSVSCAPPAGSSFSQGTTTVACTATDTAGNTANCSFTVTVNDTEAPVASCPADILAATDPGTCAAAITFTAGASDNCPGATVACLPASGSFFAVGTTTVACTATDTAGNTANCSFTVTVNDTEAPVASCPADILAATDPGTCAAAITFTAGASDNCPGATVVCSPASGTSFALGTTPVTCTATDASGNTANCSFTVTVEDSEAPTITCPADVLVSIGSLCGDVATVTFPDPTVTDNCGVAEVSCSVLSGSAFPVGSTTVNCTATDTSGNSGSCSFLVIVSSTPVACDEIQVEPDLSRVHFDAQGQSQFAFFRGGLAMTGGSLAQDFRLDPADEAQGTLKVTLGGSVVYCNDQITFALQDQNDPANNRERWKYNAGTKEKMLLRWKDDQAYDATRDPNVPESAATGNLNIGKLETKFIHDDETRFRYNFKQADKPITIAVDGLVLLTVDASGNVSSPFPLWRYGKAVDVLYPGRLVPGNTIAWYADGDLSNNGGLPENLIYEHEASANGTATDTYYNAGGRFFIKVPVTGLAITADPRSALIEFTIGQQGMTLTGCGSFAIGDYAVVGKNWKYNDGPDDCESED